MDSSKVSSPPVATQDVDETVLDETLADPSDTPAILSKKAQKRILKAQKREEFKLERRAKEKAAKAAKKAARREEAKNASAKAVDADGNEDGDGEPSAKKRKLVDGAALPVQNGEGGDNASRSIRREPFGAKIVIDLGFDEKMTDRVGVHI